MAQYTVYNPLPYATVPPTVLVSHTLLWQLIRNHIYRLVANKRKSLINNKHTNADVSMQSIGGK